MENERSIDVFISYSTKNLDTAEQLCEFLERRSIKCWYAKRNISPGEVWSKAIMQALRESKCFLLIYTEESNQSEQVANEVDNAFRFQCVRIPFLISKTEMDDTLAYYLSRSQWIDATDRPFEEACQSLYIQLKECGIEPRVGTLMPNIPKGMRVADRKKQIMSHQIAEQGQFRSDITRNEVCSITFLSSLDELPEAAWDVSEEQNHSVWAWYEYGHLIIATEGVLYAPEDCCRMFEEYGNLREINFNGCFNTSKVKDMSRMFACCRKLERVDINGFDTSNVEDMFGMFLECNNLKTIDVSGFVTSNVEDMERMFSGCSQVRELNVSRFDTSNVQDMTGMFAGCRNLRRLDISNFDTSNVIEMREMFRYSTSLYDIKFGEFKLDSLQDARHMFTDCPFIENPEQKNSELIRRLERKSRGSLYHHTSRGIGTRRYI